MKRVITLIMAIFMLATSCFALSGCFKNPDMKTIGDFMFRYKEDSTAAHLHKLSKQGKEKATLVIPSHLPNGLPVTSMGGSGFFAGAIYSNIVSEKLEKIFIPDTMASIPDHSIQSASPIIVVIAPNEAVDPWILNQVRYGERVKLKISIVEQQHYERLVNKIFAITQSLLTAQKIETRLKQPNVEFYLNYETENPLFWFDYETGEYVQRHYEGTYEPTREGYTFAGWYKEPECINDWNFDIDKMPKYETEELNTASISESDIPTGKEASNFFNKLYNSIITKENDRERVRLYAKWTKE